MSPTVDNNQPLSCANCGKGEESAGDLKACTACNMVKYCNRDCQIAHRPQHKKACKKRAAELHDEALFKQPPLKEDCPICFLLLPLPHTGSRYKVCCGKVICSGCIHAVRLRDNGVGLCPFCRTPAPITGKEVIEMHEKRIEVGDATATYNLGCDYSKGEYGVTQDHGKALELWQQAGELGNAKAFYNIGNAYHIGEGVERDSNIDKKATRYYELAAMGGHSKARHNLGSLEWRAGNSDKALKHLLIAAGAGYNNSVKSIQQLYKAGHATKEDYTNALRAYQAYLGEIRSEQRDEAAAFNDRYKYY